MAHRFEAKIGRAASLCRLSGDEFMVVLPDAGQEGNAALLLADTLIRQLGRPFDLEGQVLHATVSIGVAVSPQHGRSAETLMRHVDAALYEAKRAGLRQPCLFSPPMLARLTEQEHIRGALHQSLHRLPDQFRLLYQPQRRLSDGCITGVEALLRWRLPDGTVPASPERFIPVAEESGLIVPLGDWVLDEACRQAAAWPELVVAVNVSAMQFRGGDFSGRATACRRIAWS